MTTFFRSDLEKLVETGRGIGIEHPEIADGFLTFEHFNEQYRTPWPPPRDTAAFLKGFCTCEMVGPITRDRSNDDLGPPGSPAATALANQMMAEARARRETRAKDPE